MVSKNNIVNHLKFKSDNKQRFTIKKFAVGAASVLIGTTLYVGSGAVSADEVNSASGDNVAEVVTNSDDVSDDKNEDAKSSEADDVVDDTTSVAKDSNVAEEVAPVQDATNVESTESNTEPVDTVNSNQDNTVNDVTKSDDVVESDKVDTDNNSNDNGTVNSTDVTANTNTISNNNSVLRSANDANSNNVDVVDNKPTVENKVDDKEELGTINVYAYNGYSVLVPTDDTLSHEPLLKIPYYNGTDNVVDLEPYRAQLAKVMSNRVLNVYSQSFGVDPTEDYNNFLEKLKQNPNYLADQFVFVDQKGNKVSYLDPNSYNDGSLNLYLVRTSYDENLDGDLSGMDILNVTGSDFFELQDLINKNINININNSNTQSFELDTSNLGFNPMTDSMGVFVPLSPNDSLRDHQSMNSDIMGSNLGIAEGLVPYRPTLGISVDDKSMFDLYMNEIFIPINVVSSVNEVPSGTHYLNTMNFIKFVMNGFDSDGNKTNIDVNTLLDVLAYLRNNNTFNVNKYLGPTYFGEDPISKSISYAVIDALKQANVLNTDLDTDAFYDFGYLSAYTSDKYEELYDSALKDAQDKWAAGDEFYEFRNYLYSDSMDNYVYYLPYYDENNTIVPGKYVGLLSFVKDSNNSKKYNVTYKPIDANYRGRVDNLYRVSAGGSNGSTSGFNTIVFHQNAVENVTFVNVGTPENPTNKELSKLEGTGETGMPLDLDVDAQIKYYESLGYKVVFNDYDPNANYNIKPRNFVVKLQHNTEEVTETKDVTRTIHYVAKSDPSKTLSPDVTQTLTFIRTGVKDLVTNEITWGEWSPEQSFDPVKSPDVENYRPESATVAAQMVGYDSNNIEVTVPYVTKGSMTVDFIDDITGKVVGSFTHDGFGGDQFGDDVYIDFNNTYDRLINIEHYQSVDSNINDKFTEFSALGYIENEDRKLEVHLIHQLDKRVINTSRQLSWVYKYKDTGDDVADLDYDDIVYGSYKTTDLVTGDVTYAPIVIDGYNLDGSFLGSGEPLGDPVLGSKLKLPEKSGYSTYIAKKWLDAMEGKVSDDETLVKIDDFPAFNLLLANKALVGPTMEDLLSVKIDDINWGPVTVWYVKDDQHINVKYVDDTTGKELHVDSMTGKSDESSGYTTKDKINEYLNKGYKLVSDDTNGETLVYDNDSNVDQEYVVHLVQDTEVVNESKVVNHTIHYVESPVNTQIFDDVHQQVTFNREGSKNKVTGEITWNEWSPEQTFESVTSPVKKGYTADKPVVSGVVATHESGDLETYVFYVADNQHIKVTYIDDVTGAVLSVDDLDGSTGTSSDYSTQESIKKYESQGYKVVSDDTDGKILEFDDDSDTDQEYVVHLTHATEQVSDSKSVNRVVHYVDQNNNKLFDDHVDKALTFDRIGSKDLVTGEITWDAWTPATQEFDLVVSPTKAGYTPSVKFVPSSEVTAGSENIEETVVYVPNKQYVVVNYIDDTTGDILTTDSLNGVSEEALDYTTKPKIEDYVSLGYELVSDETNGQSIVLDSDDDATQIYNVHLKHVFDALSDSKTVKRTVHYVDGDGNKLLDDYVYPSKEFIRTGVKDKVTGEISWNEWSHVEPFNSITSPTITGYVPDFAQVDEFMPTPESGDTEFTVTYNKTEQKAQITFIDDTLDKVLTVQDANGKFGETIVFDQLDETLNEYLNGGYKVVSNDFNNQTYKADDSENNYVIHLTHGVDEVSEDKIITRTINYVDSDGNVLKDPVVQTTTLIRTGSKDLVTGEVTWNEWTTGSYELVKSPMIDGYNEPDVLEVPNTKVTADDEDSVVNVTYTAVVEEVRPEPEPEQPTEPETKPEVETEVPKQETGVPEIKVEQTPTEAKVENVVSPKVQQVSTDSKVDNVKSNELPQMGDEDNTMPALVGLSLVGMMLGALGYRSKKKHD